jgi:hypothetical protein
LQYRASPPAGVPGSYHTALNPSRNGQFISTSWRNATAALVNIGHACLGAGFRAAVVLPDALAFAVFASMAAVA